jgi:hypothetical protein
VLHDSICIVTLEEVFISLVIDGCIKQCPCFEQDYQ